MASYQTKAMTYSRFTWGDVVRVIQAAPQSFRPGQLGSVVGFRGVGLTNQPSDSNVMLVSVEFGDGDTMEVPDTYLESASTG
jgi:hypothetical protein